MDCDTTLRALIAPYLPPCGEAPAGPGLLVPRVLQEQRRRLQPYAGAEWLAAPGHGPAEGVAGVRRRAPGLRVLLQPPFGVTLCSSSAAGLGAPLDPELTLQEALRGHTVVEFPSLLVTLV